MTSSMRSVWAIGFALALGCGARSPDDSLGDAGTDHAPPDTNMNQSSDAHGTETASDGATDNSFGDANTPLLVFPAQFITENTPLRMLASGDAIDLTRALQGGHVSMLGAKVKNLIDNVATLKVRARRPDTGFIVAETSRTVAMVAVPGEPELKQPDLQSRSQYAHLPLCPDYDAVDIIGLPLELEIEVAANYTLPTASGSARIIVKPSCESTGGAIGLCTCECSAGYSLGKCIPDARAP